VCATLGDARAARSLYEQARPFAARNIVIPPGSVFYGAMSQHVGLLAATAGLLGEAASHYTDAIERLRKMGAFPFLALVEADQAALLLARGGPGDRAPAADAADRAAETARRLGMESLVPRAEALGREARAAAEPAATRRATAAPVHPLGAVPEEVVFRRDGDYWTIAYDDGVIRLRDSKGLQYLAHLLRHPGEEFLALDLVKDVSREGLDVRPSSNFGNAGPLLDEAAKAAYKDRLHELRDQLAEAEANHDRGRAERACAEIEAIGEQLAAAVGLGGRDRPGNSNLERARSTVTKGIKTAIAKIRAVHPSAGRHLGRTVRTGYFCVYAPDPEERTTWVVRTS